MGEAVGWGMGPAETWEPPDELRAPSKVIEYNLAIQMLTSEYLDSNAAEKVGLFIAERSRLNLWFYREAKGSGRSSEELLRLTTLGREQARHIYAAWQSFAGVISRGLRGDDVRADMAAGRVAVVDALDIAISNLRAARGEADR